MRNIALTTIFLIAINSLSTGATAQNIYKCGDTYSQQACPGAVVVNAADKRTREQKSQTDAATGRDARTANAMASARLQQEKIDIAANTPSAKPATAEPAPQRLFRPAQTRVKKKKGTEQTGGKPTANGNTKQALKKTSARKNEIQP